MRFRRRQRLLWQYLFVVCLTGSSVLSATWAAPQRIVSLDLCTDWMIARYVESERVVALSRYIDRYKLSWIDDEWPTHRGLLEEVLVLQPDLVLVGEYNAMSLRQRLQALGVRVEVLPFPTSLNDIATYERRFFNALELAEQPRSDVPVADKRVDRQRLLVLGANGIGMGHGTFEDDVIRYAGWENYLTHEGYVNLDIEQLIINPPDAMLLPAAQTPALAYQFAQHPVLKKRLSKDKWISTEAWQWQCPGPWSWELIESIRPK